MKSLTELLTFLNNNWTFIVIIIGLALMLYKKIQSYMKLSTDEKIDAALTAIRNTIVSKMVDAQLDWYGIKDAGSAKRSEVISQIYDEYPILKAYSNQDELIKEIDKIIDQALNEVKELADKAIDSNVIAKNEV